MTTRRKITIALLFIITVAVGVGAVYLGSVLQTANTNPNQTNAASQEVWNAEVPKTAAARLTFSQKWRTLESSPGFSFQKAREFLEGDGARFQRNTPILKVENETLYGRDLNYYLFFYYYDKYTSADPLTDADVDPGIDILISDSLVLQRASEVASLKLDNSFYNSLEKDFVKRNKTVDQFRPVVAKLFVDTIEGEAIFIWFSNSIVPQSEASGRVIAEAKINAIYDKLNKGEITMKQAGDLIANDPDIKAKVDPTAAGNAYYQFTSERGGPVTFQDPNLEQQLWALGEGQLSKVLVGKSVIGTKDTRDFQGDITDSSKNKDVFFVIIKVNKRSSGTKYQTTQQFETQGATDSKSSGQSQVYLNKTGQ